MNNTVIDVVYQLELYDSFKKEKKSPFSGNDKTFFVRSLKLIDISSKDRFDIGSYRSEAINFGAERIRSRISRQLESRLTRR